MKKFTPTQFKKAAHFMSQVMAHGDYDEEEAKIFLRDEVGLDSEQSSWVIEFADAAIIDED